MNISTLTLEERVWFEQNRNLERKKSSGPALCFKGDELPPATLTMLLELGVKGKIFAQLQNNVYGFCVVYFDHPSKAVEKPEVLIRLSSNQFPGFKGFKDQERLLTKLVGPQISHTKNNLEILKFYGLEQNPDPAHYAY